MWIWSWGRGKGGPIWVGPHVGGGGGPYVIALVQKVHSDPIKGSIVSHSHSLDCCHCFGQCDYTVNTYHLSVVVSLVLQ